MIARVWTGGNKRCFISFTAPWRFCHWEVVNWIILLMWIFLLLGRHMMTSWNGNIFRVTGHLCGEFTGPGESPAQRPVTQNFLFSLICAWIKGWVNNRKAGDLRRYRVHYDVIIMTCCTHNASPSGRSLSLSMLKICLLLLNIPWCDRGSKKQTMPSWLARILHRANHSWYHGKLNKHSGSQLSFASICSHVSYIPCNTGPWVRKVNNTSPIIAIISNIGNTTGDKSHKR